ncbi:Hsp33 family molecular chaperone HslO [Clostridioides difficile]|uniref:Hsp33 family molecular chaperone HslO n=1 Tax=Clostridioides difficile TaxID=1496 RepID=UPI002ED04B7D
MKNDSDKLTVIIKGGGPIGTIIATSDSKGMVKGYVRKSTSRGLKTIQWKVKCSSSSRYRRCCKSYKRLRS